MKIYDLTDCTVADIDRLTYDDLYGKELTNQLFAIADESHSEYLRIKGLIQNRANKFGIGPAYKEYLQSLEEELDEYNGTDEFSGKTAFGLDGWESLNCGAWIADKKGVRKKGAKVKASLSPIQPIEILENASSGIEKVKLQYYKNGKTRYLITDRNMIAAK